MKRMSGRSIGTRSTGSSVAGARRTGRSLRVEPSCLRLSSKRTACLRATPGIMHGLAAGHAGIVHLLRSVLPLCAEGTRARKRSGAGTTPPNPCIRFAAEAKESECHLSSWAPKETPLTKTSCDLSGSGSLAAEERGWFEVPAPKRRCRAVSRIRRDRRVHASLAVDTLSRLVARASWYRWAENGDEHGSAGATSRGCRGE
jgi:hypothetical protein